jgi:hypothetical protein
MKTAEELRVFMAEWAKKNIGSLGDHTDPSDRKYMIQQWAKRFTEDARASGFYYSSTTDDALRDLKGAMEFVESRLGRIEMDEKMKRKK